MTSISSQIQNPAPQIDPYGNPVGQPRANPADVNAANSGIPRSPAENRTGVVASAAQQAASSSIRVDSLPNRVRAPQRDNSNAQSVYGGEDAESATRAVQQVRPSGGEAASTGSDTPGVADPAIDESTVAAADALNRAAAPTGQDQVSAPSVDPSHGFSNIGLPHPSDTSPAAYAARAARAYAPSRYSQAESFGWRRAADSFQSYAETLGQIASLTGSPAAAARAEEARSHAMVAQFTAALTELEARAYSKQSFGAAASGHDPNGMGDYYQSFGAMQQAAPAPAAAQTPAPPPAAPEARQPAVPGIPFFDTADFGSLAFAA